MWGEQDSNLRSRRQQIYSLPQLATLVSPLVKILLNNEKTDKSISHYLLRVSISLIITSQWRDSNPRPADYKSAALAS